MNLPCDMWGYIFKFLYSENIRTSLNLRINKTSNDAFLKLLGEHHNIFPRRTFIQMNVCMHCDRLEAEDIGCITYLHDAYLPRRQLVFCKRLECLLHAVGRFIKDANDERLFPLVKFEDKKVWIPRSSGGFSVGQILKHSPISVDKKGNMCAFATMSDKIVFNLKCQLHEEHEFTLQKKVIISLIPNIGSVDINPIFCKLFMIKS